MNDRSIHLLSIPFILCRVVGGVVGAYRQWLLGETPWTDWQSIAGIRLIHFLKILVLEKLIKMANSLYQKSSLRESGLGNSGDASNSLFSSALL